MLSLMFLSQRVQVQLLHTCVLALFLKADLGPPPVNGMSSKITGNAGERIACGEIKISATLDERNRLWEEYTHALSTQ